MKRSEMLLYLEQQLIELRGYKENNLEIVEVLLFAIEEAGMLPPPVETEFQRPLSDTVCSEFSVYYNTEDIDWEPEDDQ